MHGVYCLLLVVFFVLIFAAILKSYNATKSAVLWPQGRKEGRKEGRWKCISGQGRTPVGNDTAVWVPYWQARSRPTL